MLVRNITYEDSDGNEQTKAFSFHLSKREIVKILAEYEGGFEEAFQRILETKNNKEMIALFDRFVLGALGEKGEEGRFIKNEEIIKKFIETFAYDALFDELSTDDKAFLGFIEGVFPKGVREEMMKALNEEIEKLKQLES
jgi:hypothetical protein